MNEETGTTTAQERHKPIEWFVVTERVENFRTKREAEKFILEKGLENAAAIRGRIFTPKQRTVVTL